MQVGHRHSVQGGLGLHLREERAGGLVVGLEVAAFGGASVPARPVRHVGDQQGPGDQEPALAVAARGAAAERAEIEMADRGVVGRSLAERRHPGVLAGVQVDGRDALVRRLEERQSLGASDTTATADPPPLAARGVRRRDRHPGRLRSRLNVEDAGQRIERGAGMVRSTRHPRHRERRRLASLARHDRGREHRSQEELVGDLERLLPQFRREVDQIVDRDALEIEGRRPGRKGLGRCRPLPGHRGLRYRALLDRPDRLARDPVEDVGEGRLGHLGDDLPQPAVDHDVGENGGGGDVPVPDAVMNGLEVPDALAGFGVEAEQALGVDVGAGPVAAPKIAGRRRRGDVYVAELLVAGHRSPDVGAANPLPGVVVPRLGELLALPRNRVEPPLRLAGTDVVGAHVAGRKPLLRRRRVGDSRAHDEGVADHDPGRTGADVALEDLLAAQPVIRQVDDAVLSEGGVGASRREVQRDQLLAAGDEDDALGLAVGPVLEAAGSGAVGSRELVALRVVEPEFLTGRGVQGGDLPQAGRHVHPAADHERRAPERPRFLPQVVIGRLPAPGDL